jgi:hypothetical protein
MGQKQAQLPLGDDLAVLLQPQLKAQPDDKHQVENGNQRSYQTGALQIDPLRAQRHLGVLKTPQGGAAADIGDQSVHDSPAL